MLAGPVTVESASQLESSSCSDRPLLGGIALKKIQLLSLFYSRDEKQETLENKPCSKPCEYSEKPSSRLD